MESARGESGEGGIGEDEVDKLNQELKDMRDSLAEKSKKLTERTEGAAKYDGFSLWVKIICRTYRVFSLTWPASMQIYGNKRKRLHKKRVQLPQDFFWDTNMATVLLLWDTNMATMTSCENTLYI